jgi:hypothetical protein
MDSKEHEAAVLELAKYPNTGDASGSSVGTKLHYSCQESG